MAGDRAKVASLIADLKNRIAALETTFNGEYPASSPLPPQVGDVVRVQAGQSVQAAVDAACASGVATTIILQDPVQYGDLILRNKATTTPILIRTPYDPPYYWTQQRKQAKPKLRYVETAPKAHDYGILGIGADVLDSTHPEFRDQGFWSHGTTHEASADDLPDRIVFDRVHLACNPAKGGHKGILTNARSCSVINSVFDQFWQQHRDSCAVGGWFGPGPFRVENCYIEASGINSLYGGGGVGFAGPPSGLTFRRNHCFKRPEWKPVYKIVGPNPQYWNLQDIEWISGLHYASKNLFELKALHGGLIERNIFENCWPDAQDGHALLFTAREATIDDIIFRHNLVLNAEGYAIQFLSQQDDGTDVGKSKNFQVYDNLFLNMWAGIFINKGWDDLSITNNTFTGIKHVIMGLTGKFDPDAPAPVVERDRLNNFRYESNLTDTGSYYLVTDNETPGPKALVPHLGVNPSIKDNIIGTYNMREPMPMLPGNTAHAGSINELLDSVGRMKTPMSPRVGADIDKIIAANPWFKYAI